MTQQVVVAVEDHAIDVAVEEHTIDVAVSGPPGPPGSGGVVDWVNVPGSVIIRGDDGDSYDPAAAGKASLALWKTGMAHPHGHFFISGEAISIAAGPGTGYVQPWLSLSYNGIHSTRLLKLQSTDGILFQTPADWSECTLAPGVGSVLLLNGSPVMTEAAAQDLRDEVESLKAELAELKARLDG